MNQAYREFNHFVDSVRHETSWPIVQYTQYDRARRIVSECARSVRPDLYRFTEGATVRALVGQPDPYRWSVDHNSYWHQVYCEGRIVRTSLREYMQDDEATLSLADNVFKSWPLNYVCLTPVIVDDVVRGAIAAFASDPFSIHDVESLRRYVREAQALERVTELEQRTGMQAIILSSMLKDIIRLQDQTAQAIAEHLHANVQSHLLVAWHQLQQCQELLYDDPKHVQALLEKTMDILDTVRDQQIRQLSHALHPALIRIALVPAIKQLVDRFAGLFDIRLNIGCEVVECDSPMGNPIPLDYRLALYRVLEESLSNLVQHSCATMVDIFLAVRPPSLITLELVDNGRVWDVDPSKPHLGLLTMTTRAEQIGGTLSFARLKGHNRMVFTIPIPALRPLSNTS